MTRNTSLFEDRHIGPAPGEVTQMLELLGVASLDELTGRVVPAAIQFKGSALDLGEYAEPLSEVQVLERLRSILAENKVYRSYIGMGYSDCVTPPVILRNILENPGWYTQYTPYQAEISQGRLEALLNFQTMICDLTGLPVSNASLLDEATAAAEAMALSFAASKRDGAAVRPKFFVASDCHPQTIAVIQTRAEPLGVEIVIGDPAVATHDEGTFGMVVQYPNTYGVISDLRPIVQRAKAQGIIVTVAADLLALALLKSPAEFDADIAVGSAQRFGVPLGYGGPHAAFFATKDEYKRLMPGRLIGVSKDSAGEVAMRLALQTREQHIRREKATSNICTAQVLLAIIASMYAVYHGPTGIRRIAQRINDRARDLAGGLRGGGYSILSERFFDTVVVSVDAKRRDQIIEKARAANINLRAVESGVAIALDERCDERSVAELLRIFDAQASAPTEGLPSEFLRTGPILAHPVFNRYHSETEFLRYLKRLESKDLSLCVSMIPLGSCTMKLNATTEMIPVTWPEVGALHPFAPPSQTLGYQRLFRDLEAMLCAVTGFDSVSLQPNAGSQGEYAGLLAIRGYHASRGETNRTICLIPKSAHGTNPASAAMAGMSVVVVECDEQGNIALDDLRKKAGEAGSELAAMMVTYPSTHGVFEERISEAIAIVHQHGGQVYMDGANLNALVGLCRPVDIGADVCHINLHKTFCIPHGGGGPGMGPIGVRAHLAPFLPGHPVIAQEGRGVVGPVSAAPWGSASILVISWSYIAMMGARGLKRASQIAILNANYISRRLADAFPTLYRGAGGFVAHECILDLREIKKRTGVEVEDVAKRLMDYGFHAPTVSFPVAGTLMVEPTESESKVELDRFCDAMLQIREEIARIERGELDKSDNPLKCAPHTARAVTATEWSHGYSREEAAFPCASVRQYKFWPAVGRVDSSFGDRYFFCTCPPLGE